MSTRLPLTEQQQAIVAHNHGPALVYAVAGAGKTTAMVHRIARLVQEGIFAPQRILATSFNKEANEQIKAALARWPACQSVQVRTLHAVGYAVVKLACERGCLPAWEPVTSAARGGTVEQRLLQETLRRARSARGPLAAQLDTLDPESFLAFVRVSKASLAFAETPADLSWRARRALSAPQPPKDRGWYLELYRLFERVRVTERLMTFDDMLTTGWEMLARHPELLASMQSRYECVLVDEYQDVNRAQVELLDLLTAPHRNYMAIGDDDQTIYEWRGASPHYLRSFRTRYRAAVYFMTDNFRSHASQLALANQVIRHDPQRQPKYLQLTRGFGGLTTVAHFPGDEGVAEACAQTMLRLHAGGHAYREMAVLVRIYHQTGAIEDALRRAGIPFSVLRESDVAIRTPTGVTITSIYRAKGLEWPVVFVPGCNDGMLPYSQTEYPAEERRLLYVAITRARERLYLFARADRPLSPFLVAADHAAVLAAVAQVESALARTPAAWTFDDYLAVAVNAKRLYLHEYFLRWWSAAPPTRQAVASAVLRFYAALARAGLLRRLDLGRSDSRLWRLVAGAAVDETPLAGAEMAAGLAQLTGR